MFPCGVSMKFGIHSAKVLDAMLPDIMKLIGR